MTEPLTIITANNPAAVRPLQGATWNGQIGEAVAGRSGRFAKFDTMASGIRAALRNLHTYRHKHGLETPRAIIDRWAPPVENNTSAYVRHVAAALGIDEDARIPVDYHHNRRLIEAIIQKECGPAASAVPGSAIDEAFRRMGAEEASSGRDPGPYTKNAVEGIRRLPKQAPQIWGWIKGTAATIVAWFLTRIENGDWVPTLPRDAFDRLPSLPAWNWYALAPYILAAALAVVAVVAVVLIPSLRNRKAKPHEVPYSTTKIEPVRSDREGGAGHDHTGGNPGGGGGEHPHAGSPRFGRIDRTLLRRLGSGS